MKYHFKVHKERKGYWAECLELKGCATQANSKKELLAHARDALNLFLDEPENSNVIFPEPRKTVRSKDVVEISVDPQIAFAMMLRQERVKNHLTQTEVATKLGLKNAYSYQRLENSKTANPSLTTIVMLKTIFPDLRLDTIVA